MCVSVFVVRASLCLSVTLSSLYHCLDSLSLLLFPFVLVLRLLPGVRVCSRKAFERVNRSTVPSFFVFFCEPNMAATLPQQVHAVRSLVASAERLVVLTGAGISTDSGIPDYRSPGRPPHKPTNHAEFMRNERARHRYWARSMIGVPHGYDNKLKRTFFFFPSLSLSSFFSFIFCLRLSRDSNTSRLSNHLQGCSERRTRRSGKV